MPNTHNQYEHLEICARLALLQFSTVHRLDNKELIFSNYVIGYIAGLGDCYVQWQALEEYDESIAVISELFLHIFGEESGAVLVEMYLDLLELNDQLFLSGMVDGGTDLQEWRNRSQEPTKLATWLLNMDAVKSSE